MDAVLLDKIYEAALLPHLWEDVLESISRIAGGHAGALIAVRPGDAPRYIVTNSYAGEAFHQIMSSGITSGNVRPARAFVKYPMGFSTDLEICTSDELDRDPIYLVALRPNGFEWTAGTAIPVPSGDIMMFDLARKAGYGPFQRSEMEAIDLYRPHLARAALMSARLELAEATAAIDALQRLGLPAASVTETGTVNVANDLFASIAPRVRIGAFDKLELQDAMTYRRVMRGIQRNSDAVRAIPISATISDPLSVTISDPPLILHLLPVTRAANDIFTRSSAVLIVTPVTAPNAPLTELLTGLFDLTSAEARIASGVAGGKTVQQIASTHNVSPETVRTQLKTVLNKTGTTRQTELALLLTGAGKISFNG